MEGVPAALSSRADLTLENLALRQQLALLGRHRSDRDSVPSIASSGCGSPPTGLNGERPSI
jgi:hypothetical protein